MRPLLAAVLAAVAAAPTTGPATDVTATSATLHATVDPGATYHFEYGTTDDYGLATESFEDEDEDGAVDARVRDLTKNTT